MGLHKKGMPRFNLISKDADGVGFAIHLQAEGHSVRVYIDEEQAQSVGDGLIPKVGSIHEMLEDADPIEDTFIFDNSGDGLTADYLRSLGFKVMGASAIADVLERDRAFGLNVMTSCGVKVPKTTEFTSFEAAKKYVEKNKDKKLVYKPSNLLGDKSPSHVSYNAEDLVEFLEIIESNVDMAEPLFVLQEFHPGIAVSSEVWFDGRNFLPLFNHTLERKELMNDNKGPSGGCTGNVVWACSGDSKECPLCMETRKLEKWLRSENYEGMLDLNVIVAEDGIYGLEWTPRFGYDATPTLCLGLFGNDLLGDFFFGMARASSEIGRRALPSLEQGTFAAGLRLSIPPWPSEKYLAEADLPIFGLEDSILDCSYLFNVKQGKVTQLATAGVWGIIACITGTGDTIKSAFKKPYKIIDNCHVANKQYRTDLVTQFEEDLIKLEQIIGASIGLPV